MNKTKIYSIIVVLTLAFVIIPQMALAAWWNPFSWGWVNRIFHFQKQIQVEKKIEKVDEKSKQKDLSVDVFPLFSNLKWSDQSAKTIIQPVSNLAISGYEIKAVGQIKQDQDAILFMEYYDKKLKSLGWSTDNYFAADGITGSQVGYNKNNNYIVLGYSIKPGKIISNPDEPMQWTCPCNVTYSIFTSISGQAADQTASWKTYTNSKYGFEFKYPNNYSFYEPGAGNGIFAIGLKQKQTSLNVRVYYRNGESVNEWISQNPGSDNVSHYSTLMKNIKVDGIDGVVATPIMVADRANYYTAIFPKGSYMYEILVASDYGEDAQDAMNLLEQIIPTFNFKGLSKKTSVDDCIMYGELKGIKNCYDEYCTKINPTISADFLIGKGIMSAYASGMTWDFLDNKNVLIKRGHPVDTPVIPAQNGTWSIKNGEIYIQDPLINSPVEQFVFKGLHFYNCGNNIVEGVSVNSFLKDYGSDPEEVISEYRIQTLK